MRSTYIAAAIIAVVIVLWFLSGTVGKEESAGPPPSLAAQNEAMRAQSEDKAPTRVRARVVNAELYTEKLTLRGRTENKRTVMVRAETNGRVIERPIERGDRVEQGQLLCRIATDDRRAGVTEAREALRQAQIEYQGAVRLQKKGFQSDTAIAQAKARLASAQAQLERRNIELARTEIRAPFAGMVENTGAEIGDVMSPGGTCATIVDLNPMLLVGEVAERAVTQVKVGTTAQGFLADGRVIEGVVTFVGQQSNDLTRTYPVEIQVDNASLELRSGITAEIRVPLAEVTAHQVSPALLALDDAGEIGIRTLDDNQRVEFRHVDILDDDAGGVWLSGLPQRATIITVGQELVVPGERVEAEFEGSQDMPAQAPPARDPIAPTVPPSDDAASDAATPAAEPVLAASS